MVCSRVARASPVGPARLHVSSKQFTPLESRQVGLRQSRCQNGTAAMPQGLALLRWSSLVSADTAATEPRFCGCGPAVTLPVVTELCFRLLRLRVVPSQSDISTCPVLESAELSQGALPLRVLTRPGFFQGSKFAMTVKQLPLAGGKRVSREV